MNRMEYKGYTAKIEYSTEDRALFGRVLDIRDVIVFHADNVEDLEKEFHGMVDFYLEQCAKDGIEPGRMFSGKLNVRMPPEEHRRLSIEAEIAGRSINDIILSAINAAYPGDYARWREANLFKGKSLEEIDEEAALLRAETEKAGRKNAGQGASRRRGKGGTGKKTAATASGRRGSKRPEYA